jgi:hypothetical protein
MEGKLQMSWVYFQSNGELMYKGALVGTGYAGFGEGMNNPNDQAIPNVGPIPAGLYTIGPAFTHPAAGPITMRLTPQDGTNTLGRDGFLMHGDTASQDHTASHGCIVMPRTVRAAVAVSNDRTLNVIPK